MGEVNDGQIVRASHADSLSLTRPDGTTVQIPAKCVLAIDAVLRRILDTHERLRVNRLEFAEGGWLASLWLKGHKSANVGGGDTPWQAVLSLAEKLKETA